jgi:hypothetical protein
MINRKAFNFFRSYWETGKMLDDKNRLAFYDAIFEKQFNDKEIELTGMANFAYITQKFNINSQVEGYKSKIGSNLTTPTAPPCQPPSVGGKVPPCQPPSVQEKEKGEVKGEVKGEDGKNKNFIPPQQKEVFDYCQERKNGIDANKFINYYQAKGWMIGKNKMKDWKAAVRTWENSQSNNNQNQETKPLVSEKMYNYMIWDHHSRTNRTEAQYLKDCEENKGGIKLM